MDVYINKEDLSKIINKINIVSNDILRKNEQIYNNLGLRSINLSVDKTVDIILTNQILLQRPIIAKNEYNELSKAIIARPPEKILTTLD